MSGTNGSNGNSNGAFYKWVTGILTAVLVGAGSWGLTRITTLEERSTRQEERVVGLSKQLDRIDTTLLKISRDQEQVKYLVLFKDNPEMLRLLFPAAQP